MAITAGLLDERKVGSISADLAAAGYEPLPIGTLGWTAADLDDETTRLLFTDARCEIINGALIAMPAAKLNSTFALMRLGMAIGFYLREQGLPQNIGPECGILIDDDRVVRADMIYMTAAQRVRQDAEAAKHGKNPDEAFAYVAPTLVIESVSEGHEKHDRVTKFNWYAEFGVSEYWIFDTLNKRIDCYTLRAGRFELTASGAGNDVVETALFPGLSIDLGTLWAT